MALGSWVPTGSAAQFALAFVGFFNLIGSLGTYQYIVKHIARDPAELGRLVISALRLKMVMGVVLAALALGTGWLLGYDGEVLTLIAIGLVGMMLSLLNEMVLAGLAGLELIAGSAVWQTVQVYVGSILAIVVLLTTKSLYVPRVLLAGPGGAAGRQLPHVAASSASCRSPQSGHLEGAHRRRHPDVRARRPQPAVQHHRHPDR